MSVSVLPPAPQTEVTDSVPKDAVGVLHLINGEHYAGAERVQDLLAAHLPEQGFAASLACVCPNEFPKMRHATDAPLFEVPMCSRLDLRPAWKIARLIRREKFALLHTHTPRTAMLGRVAASLAGVPMVHHVHGQTATEVGANWKTRLSDWTERVSLQRAAAVIAVSETSRNYIQQRGLRADVISVVPNGIASVEKLPHRQPPSDPWTLGIVGLLRPRKGLEVLLSAVALLRARHGDVRLRIVGGFETPEYEQTIHQLARSLEIENAVNWRGFQRDVPRELAAMDVFVFPSILPEGMPMVVLESMAAGVPVIASGVPGVMDIFQQEDQGILVEPNNAEALAGEVGALIGNPQRWSQIRQSARRHQQAKFSARSMSSGVAEVYRHVLSKS